MRDGEWLISAEGSRSRIMIDPLIGEHAPADADTILKPIDQESHRSKPEA